MDRNASPILHGYDKDGASTIRQLWCSSPGGIDVDNQTVPLHRTVLPAQMSSQTEISSLLVANATVAGSGVPLLMWVKSARPHPVVLVLVCSLPETFQCCHEMSPLMFNDGFAFFDDQPEHFYRCSFQCARALYFQLRWLTRRSVSKGQQLQCMPLSVGAPSIFGEQRVYMSTALLVISITFLVSIEIQLQIVHALCAHRNQHIFFSWANANPCEIIQDLVDALSPLQTMSEGHEEHFAALEAVQKTAKEQVSGESQRTTEQTREFTCRCLKLPRKNLDIRCPTVPNVFAGSTLLFRTTTKLNGLQVCLGGCRPWKHHSPPSQEQPTSGQQWPSQILRLKSREDVLLFSAPGDPLLQVWTASEFWVLRSVTELMALVKTQVRALDFKRNQRW